MRSTEEKIMAMAQGYGYTKTAVIQVSEMEFNHDYRKYCEANYCGQYGNNHACPPDCGTPSEMEEKARRYEYALVLQTIYSYEELSELAVKKEEHNERTRKLAEQLKKEGYKGILANAGPCTYCKECARIKGETCRFPEELSSCISAYCISAEKMAASCEMEYWCKDKQVAFFSVWFFDGK